MSVVNPQKPTWDHNKVIVDVYRTALRPYLQFFDKLQSRGDMFPDYNTDELKVSITRDIEQVLHIYFIKSDGNQCDFQLHPMRNDHPSHGERTNTIQIKVKTKIPTGTRGQPLKNRQAVGLPYWFHRLVLLYSKTIRDEHFVQGDVFPIPHCVQTSSQLN